MQGRIKGGEGGERGDQAPPFRALKSAVPKFKRQFCGSASNTKADSEGKELRETTIR